MNRPSFTHIHVHISTRTKYILDWSNLLSYLSYRLHGNWIASKIMESFIYIYIYIWKWFATNRWGQALSLGNLKSWGFFKLFCRLLTSINNQGRPPFVIYFQELTNLAEVGEFTSLGIVGVGPSLRNASLIYPVLELLNFSSKTWAYDLFLNAKCIQYYCNSCAI